MSVTIPPTIDPAPEKPVRGDRATFSNRVDAFVTWEISLATQLAALATNVYNNAVAAWEAVTAAFNSQTAAAQSASDAAASAAAAALSTNVTKWVAGSFAEGQCVWSPIDYQNYRCINAGVRNTDPAADAVNWANLSTPSAWKSISASTYAAKPYEKLLVDTTANKVTISLPTVGLVAGKTTIEYIDYARNFSTNAVTFDAGANKIEGLAEAMDVTKKGMSGKLLYVDSAKGWLNI